MNDLCDCGGDGGDGDGRSGGGERRLGRWVKDGNREWEKKEIMKIGIEERVSRKREVIMGRENMREEWSIMKKEVMEIYMEEMVVNLKSIKNYSIR